MTYEDAVAEITAPGQDLELVPWTRSDGATYTVFRHAPATLRDLFDATRAYGDRTFLVYQDERRTYAETLAEADAFAAALVELGVRRGDRVAIAMRNYPEWVVAFIAITSIGAISVSMNAWWQEQETAYALENSGATVLVADVERFARAREAAERLGCRTIVVRASGPVEGATRWEDLVVPGTPRPDVPIEPDDDATILYTSGTTGRAKGAVSTHRAVTNALIAFSAIDRVKTLTREPVEPADPDQAPDPAVLLVVPLFHVTGCIGVLLSCMIGGYRIVIMQKWDPEVALQLIERERIVAFVGVPSQSYDLLQHPDFGKYDTSSLASVGGGGAAPPPTLIKQIDSEFASAAPGFTYGMTETNAVGPSISGPDVLGRPKSIGRVPPGMQVEIHDPSSLQECPTGARGEIWVRGPSLVRGYWGDESATAATFVDGWLRTGDIGHVDEDGYIYVDDRLKDMVLRGGENVYCAEVEAAIYEHPSVHEAAVFGVPHERLGEEVAAVVVLREGHALTSEELQSFLKERLAAFKVPSHLQVRSEPLPRSASGKFLKRNLREEMAGGSATPAQPGDGVTVGG
ncbi:class I adenylate-forming enzyme family protein [Blastococcus sp. SYSU D00695]